MALDPDRTCVAASSPQAADPPLTLRTETP